MNSAKNMKTLDPEMYNNIGNLFQKLNNRKRDNINSTKSNNGNVVDPSKFSEKLI